MFCRTNQYDVALLKLATPVKLGTAVSSPICLPEPGSFMRTFAARNATIAGWGLTSESANETSPTLQKLRVNVFPPSKCKKFYAHRVTRRSLCAGYEKGGKDSCMVSNIRDHKCQEFNLHLCFIAGGQWRAANHSR